MIQKKPESGPCGWTEIIDHDLACFFLAFANKDRSRLSTGVSFSKYRRSARCFKVPPHFNPCFINSAFNLSKPYTSKSSALQADIKLMSSTCKITSKQYILCHIKETKEIVKEVYDFFVCACKTTTEHL